MRVSQYPMRGKWLDYEYLPHQIMLVPAEAQIRVRQGLGQMAIIASGSPTTTPLAAHEVITRLLRSQGAKCRVNTHFARGLSRGGMIPPRENSENGARTGKRPRAP